MSSSCCIQGSIKEGTPAGRVETVHGLQAYISEPPDGAAPKAFVVMIPDAFGWDFVNLRLLADIYAKRSGARVYMPDFMIGGGIDPSVMQMMDVVMAPSPSWFSTFYNKVPALFGAITRFIPFVIRNRLSLTEPIVRKWFTEFRQNEGADKKIAATGYCWGGKFATLLCHPAYKLSSGQALIDCAFTAHPSNLVVPADIEPVELPLSISIGDNDLQLKGDKLQQTIQILTKDKPAGVHEVVVLPGAAHGFSVRGHPNDKKEMEQAQTAEDQAIAWFAKHLGTNRG